MSVTVAASTPAQGRMSRRAAVWGLAAMALCILWMRVHLYTTPLDGDTTNYAVLAREWALGRPLYTDLWLHSPPGIVWVYGLTRVLVGDGPQEMFALGLACAWGTLLAIYYAAAAMARQRGAGLWAAGFWTIFSGSLPLQFNLPSCEVVMALCMAVTLALLVRPRKTRPDGRENAVGWASVVGAGALLAFDSLVKQVTLPITLAVAAAHAAWPPEAISRRRAIAESVALLAATAVAWAGLLVWLLARGALGAFWEANVTFNLVYSRGSGSTGMLANVLAFGGSKEPRMYDLRWVLVLLGVTTITAVTRWSAAGRHSKAMLVASAAGSYLAVALPGNWYEHYYQLAVPTLCVGLGVVAVSAWPRFSPVRLPLMKVACLLLAGVLIEVNDRHYTTPAWFWPPMQFDKYEDNECEAMSTLISKLLKPGETVFDFGDDPQIYFYTGRRIPTGLLFCWTVLSDPVYQGPWSARQHEQVLADLKRTRPELFVMFDTCPPKFADAMVGGWLEANYHRRPEHVGLLTLYELDGGRSASRRPT